VDPVSHLLFARLLAGLRGARSAGPGVIAATTLGGIAPDADAVLMAWGWDVYLASHEGGTHALGGTLAVAAATAAVVRWRVPAAQWGPLMGGAWLGALSHVFLDLIASGTIQPFWPLSSMQVRAPVVAMADPWVIACMAAGACALYVWPRIPRVAGTVALALLAGVCAGKLTTRHWALDAYAREAIRSGAPVQTTVDARWGSWREWLVFDRTADGTIRAWLADGWQGEARLRFSQSDGADEPFARVSRQQFATARNFAASHAYAFATRTAADHGHVVFWSDARFCWTPAERPDPQDGVPHQDVRPPAAPLRCAMWFGGSLDADGVPVEALVWLGGHLQRRRPR
jgi:membrane-bound metal-dependent hydrolase YbcI (DUF457 family)